MLYFALCLKPHDACFPHGGQIAGHSREIDLVGDPDFKTALRQLGQCSAQFGCLRRFLRTAIAKK